MEENDKLEKEKKQKKLKSDFEKFHQKMLNRGVCYLSQLPKGYNVNQVRKFFMKYRVARVYFVPKTQSNKNMDKKQRRKYKEGWIEFENKKVAKAVANKFNGTLVPNGAHCTGNKTSEFWCIKYISKFKWDNLLE